MRTYWSDNEVFDIDESRQGWLVAKLFTDPSNILLFGHGGVRKSFLAYDLAAALATRTCFAGTHRTTMRARVLIVSGEGDAAENRKRIRAAFRAHGVTEWPENQANMLGYDHARYFLNTEEGAAAFSQRVETVRPALVVVDPLANFIAGSDWDDKNIVAFQNVVDRLKAEVGTSFLILHHEPVAREGDSTTARPRGGTRWEAWADVMMRMSITEEQTIAGLYLKKGRYSVKDRFHFHVRHCTDPDNELSFFRTMDGPSWDQPKLAPKKGAPKWDLGEDEEDDDEASETPAEELHLPPMEAVGLRTAILDYLGALETRTARLEQIRKVIGTRRPTIKAVLDDLVAQSFVEVTKVPVTHGPVTQKMNAYTLVFRPISEVHFDSYLPGPAVPILPVFGPESIGWYDDPPEFVEGENDDFEPIEH